jgi:protein SCO1/2
MKRAGIPRRRWLLGIAAGLTGHGAGCRSRRALPALGTIRPFSLTDQDGRRFGSAELAQDPWIAAFFFTRCPTVCPRITRRLRELQQRTAARLISVSVDPEHDTPEVLRRYASENGADPARWRFLTGERPRVERLSADMKQALEGRADPGAPELGILHGSHLVLIDRGLVIRGFYRSSDDAEMARLAEDVARL